jgi:hypothetical protein
LRSGGGGGILSTVNRRIPYAVANYEKIVREDHCFVDKTRFIRELEKYEIPE